MSAAETSSNGGDVISCKHVAEQAELNSNPSASGGDLKICGLSVEIPTPRHGD